METKNLEAFEMIKVGDKIKVIEVQGYKLCKPMNGTVTWIGSNGELYGTWGDFSIDPGVDKIELEQVRTISPALRAMLQGAPYQSKRTNIPAFYAVMEL